VDDRHAMHPCIQQASLQIRELVASCIYTYVCMSKCPSIEFAYENEIDRKCENYYRVTIPNPFSPEASSTTNNYIKIQKLLLQYDPTV
jgi:hypothetical protein